jgi:hypothetical protein
MLRAKHDRPNLDVAPFPMSLRTVVVLALLLSGIANIGFSADVIPVPAAETVLASLRPAHPRLMLDDAALERLKLTIKTDVTAARYFEQVLKQANVILGEPLLSYTVREDRRLLDVSRRCIERMYTLGLAWRLTGDKRYAERAEKDLLAVCAFENWTPSLAIIYPLQQRHRDYEKQYGRTTWSFLDVAEMCHGVGVGYDWFHAFLSPQSRQTIRSALAEKGLALGVAAYTNGGTTTGSQDAWTTYNHNWNMVCNGGLVVGALAVAETDPELARVIIPGAVKSLPIALTTYGPDGAWPEGPSYWSYATSYAVYGLAAMESALGTDYGLSAIDGLASTANFPLLTTGPTGLYLNFADSRELNERGALPCLFWLARRYRNDFFSDQEHATIARTQVDPLHLVWYLPPSNRPAATRQLDARFRGPTEVAVFRSDWETADALFVGVKAGDNTFNHAHLDLGTFELDALGVRWARDLGSDNYALSGYFDFYYLTQKTGGQRWSFYRMGSTSHNVPLINNENQNELATARFTSYRSQPASAHVKIDLRRAYERHASRAERGIAVINDRRAVLVQDEFELVAPAEVAWNMMTDAVITLEGSRATLSQNGKTLTAEVLEPVGASFVVDLAEQKPPQKQNKGVKRLRVRVPGKTGAVRIAVLLAPNWDANARAGKPAAKVVPLASWGENGP